MRIWQKKKLGKAKAELALKRKYDNIERVRMTDNDIKRG